MKIEAARLFITNYTQGRLMFDGSIITLYCTNHYQVYSVSPWAETCLCSIGIYYEVSKDS